MKRIAFKTVGCRLNQAETADLTGRFAAAGFAAVPWGRPCEVALVHSCTITAKADQTSARLARAATRQTPRPLVVIAGCAAQVAPVRLKERTGADLVVGQSRKFELPALVAAALTAQSRSSQKKFVRRAAPAAVCPPTPLFATTRALVKVQDGCDFHCAYCIVPQARGNPVSRPAGAVLDEIRRLARQGVREVLLTGANLGCYRDGGTRLPELLTQVETLPGVERIRIGSIELSTVEDDVLAIMQRSRKLCRYLHLPLQSGDDRVLQAMGRRYRAADYRAFVERALAALGSCGLGADIIVGFPGEDRRAFANTRALVRDLPFSNLHVFPFSPRPGTRAAALPRTAAAAEIKARVAQLIALGERQKKAFARAWLGREVSVLIEKSDRRAGARGWTAEYVPAALFQSGLRPNEIHRFVPVALVNGVLGDRPGIHPKAGARS
jgi:threonylcarbamoyladenosine tRNA methylthiotransferase MtaB